MVPTVISTSENGQTLRRTRSLISRIFLCGHPNRTSSPPAPEAPAANALRRNPHRRSTGQLTTQHSSIRKAFPISTLSLLVNLKKDTIQWSQDTLSFVVDATCPATVTMCNLKKSSVISEWSIPSGLNQTQTVKIARPGLYTVKLVTQRQEESTSLVGLQKTDLELHMSATLQLVPRVVSQTVQADNGSFFSLLEIYGRPSSVPELQTNALDVIGVANDGKECVVCLTNDRDTIVLPCRHLCLCAECAENLRSRVDKCPICRECCQGLLQVKQIEDEKEFDEMEFLK